MEDNEISLTLIPAVIVFIAMTVIGIWVYVGFGSFVCSSRWGSFSNRFSLFSGCQIKAGEKWIPSSSYYFKEE